MGKDNQREPLGDPKLFVKAVMQLTREHEASLISFETWRQGLAMYGVGMYVHPGSGLFKVHLDEWAWGTTRLPDDFVEYVRKKKGYIQAELRKLDDGTWNITPTEIMKYLARWKEYDEGVRRLVYRKALSLGVLSYIALKPWEEAPPLHETADQRKRREALEFLETITENKREIAGTEWEWDEGPGLNWCRCTYADKRVSTHFFVSQWWEGLREQRCDCPARQFNPQKPCKHEQARLCEWQRRVNQRDPVGVTGFPAEDSNG